MARMRECITTKELELSESSPVRKLGNNGVYLLHHGAEYNLDTMIYRYTDLSCLQNLMYSGKFHVSNMQSFSDIRDKLGLYRYIKNIPNISPVPSYWERLRDKNNRRALRVCASCWTFDKRSDGSNGENFLMWKSYANNSIPCRIGVRLGNLIESIDSTMYNIIIGDMVYGEMCMNELERLIFTKTIHYEHEQEIRMAVLSNKPAGIDLKINTSKLFADNAEIVISPFINIQSAITLRDMVRKMCVSKHNIDIRVSDILEFTLNGNETEQRFTSILK